MLHCPKCGSTDIYYEDTICLWQNFDSSWSVDGEEIQTVLDSDKSEKRFICNACGNAFRKLDLDKSSTEYELRVSRIDYGTATVRADSLKAALDKFNRGGIAVEYFDSEISDVTAKRL